MSDLLIDANFTNNSPNEIDGNVSFVGGNINLQGSSWNITGNLIATSGATFLTNCFRASTWNVGGNFSFAGANGNLLNLIAPDWTLNVLGTTTASYCKVANSNASAGNRILATDGTSVDNGNNQNWLFAPNAQPAIEDGLYAYLTANIGYPVYPVRVPQLHDYTTTPVAIVYMRDEGGDLQDLAGAIGLSNPHIQLGVFSFDHTLAKSTCYALRDILHGFRGTWLSLIIQNVNVKDRKAIQPGRSSDASDNVVYGYQLELSVWYEEDVPLFTTE